MDGQAVLARLRVFCAVPVIVLSARDREAEKIMALDAGAHDYVERPFALGELLARVRAALRHHAQPADSGPKLTLGTLALDPERRAATLMVAGIPASPASSIIFWHCSSATRAAS